MDKLFLEESLPELNKVVPQKNKFAYYGDMDPLSDNLAIGFVELTYLKIFKEDQSAKISL